jgi:hypothetical protein
MKILKRTSLRNRNRPERTKTGGQTKPKTRKKLAREIQKTAGQEKPELEGRGTKNPSPKHATKAQKCSERQTQKKSVLQVEPDRLRPREREIETTPRITQQSSNSRAA